MKATLEFNMEDDRGEFLRAVHGSEIYFALLEVGEMLRRYEKSDNDGITADEIVQRMRVDYYEIVGDVLAIME